jgi:hypothetical protein
MSSAASGIGGTSVSGVGYYSSRYSMNQYPACNGAYSSQPYLNNYQRYYHGSLYDLSNNTAAHNLRPKRHSKADY